MNRIGTGRKTAVWIYGVCALIFLVTAWFSIGYNHPDEHFQILEFAGLKLGMNDPAHLPWEYQFAMRPAFQPFIVWLVYKACLFTGISDPFTVAFLMRILEAAITFLSILMTVRLYSAAIVNRTLVTPFLLLSFLLFFVVYNSVRFSSDTLSGRLFIIGFAWFFLSKNKEIRIYLVTGLFLGLAFITRYQVLFMAAGFVLWMAVVKRAGLRNLVMLAAGFLLTWGIGILCDIWFYGRWEFTFWNYFRQNILLDKVSGFGLNPWYDYFVQTFLNAIPPFSLLYILALLLFIFFRPKDPITWTIVPFLVVHFMIGHKELRFLHPVIGFIPFMMIAVWDKLISLTGEKITRNILARIFGLLFWIINFVMVAIMMFRPADDRVPVFRKIMHAPPGPMVLLFDRIDPYKCCYDMCFYRRPGLITRQVDSLKMTRTSSDTLYYFVTTTPVDFRGTALKTEMVYCALPEWTKMFDYNGWIERTKFWRIYRIE